MSAHILTVDDSASIRMTTKIALSNAGYTVTEAVDGADGIAKLSAGAFDLIVTDLNMPNMDGLTKPFDPENLVKIARKVLGK